METRSRAATVEDVLAKYGVSKATYHNWKKNRAGLEKAASVSPGHAKKKRQFSKDPLELVKEAVRSFFELNKQMPKDAQLPVTGSVISVRAIMMKEHLLCKHFDDNDPFVLTADEFSALEAFTASKSWCSKTAILFGLRSKVLHGEAGSVDVDAVSDDIKNIVNIIKRYKLDNVYNTDETGLFFKCLPNRSYVDNESAKDARGTKAMKAKDRVTLYVCTNATGTDKVPLSIIGKSKEPRCFRNHPKKLDYYSQAKAWSDTKTFLLWWQRFLNYIRSKTNDPVLLILDNCGPHGADVKDPNEQVTILFLPPNCTSVFQPMDAGIIAMVKKLYRYRLLRLMIEMYDERIQRREDAKKAKMQAGTMGLKEGHPPHLRDVMDILSGVWDEISVHSIKKCWMKTTLISDEMINQSITPSAEETCTVNNEPEIDPEEDEDDVDEETEIRSLFDVIVKFGEMKLSTSGNASGVDADETEFDEMLDDMAAAVSDVECDDFESMKAIFDNWVGLEETNFCKDLLMKEVSQLQDLDALCGMKNLQDDFAEEEDNDSQDDKDDRHDPDFDEINDLVNQIKTLSVKVGNLNTSYSQYAVSLDDVADGVRRTFPCSSSKASKINRRKSRQYTMHGFLNKTKK